MSTLEKVKKVVVDQLSCDEAIVRPAASGNAVVGASSLGTVELVMFFEVWCSCDTRIE